MSTHARLQGFTSRGALRLSFSAASLVVAVLFGTLTLTGCRRSLTLEQTLESPEAVAREVVTGLNARDLSGLKRLAVTEREFRELVWPKLPTSRPGRNIPWDYVWKDLHGKSDMQLQGRLNEWENRGYTVVRVEFTGEITDYQTFRIRRDSAVMLRDRDGRESRVRLFGSIIEQDGRYKVFSYVAD